MVVKKFGEPEKTPNPKSINQTVRSLFDPVAPAPKPGAVDPLSARLGNKVWDASEDGLDERETWDWLYGPGDSAQELTERVQQTYMNMMRSPTPYTFAQYKQVLADLMTNEDDVRHVINFMLAYIATNTKR